MDEERRARERESWLAECDRWVPFYAEALEHRRIGNRERALQLLNEAYQNCHSDSSFLVINYAKAFCMWELAGLELHGEIHSLNSRNVMLAKEAAQWWQRASERGKTLDERYWWKSVPIRPWELAQAAGEAAYRANLALNAYTGGWRLADTAIDRSELMAPPKIAHRSQSTTRPVINQPSPRASQSTKKSSATANAIGILVITLVIIVTIYLIHSLK